MAVEVEQIKSSLAAHNAAFEHLVDLISPKHYFSAEDWASHQQTLAARADTLGKKALKNMPLTVTQVQKAVGSQNAAVPPEDPTPSLSRPELQAKLRQRIAELAGNRGQHAPSELPPTANTEAASSSTLPVSREDLLDKRRVRRGEQRDQKRKLRKQARRRGKQVEDAKPSSANTSQRRPEDVDVEDASTPAAGPSSSYAAGEAADANLAFSSMAFSNGSNAPSSTRHKSAPSKLSKDPALATQALERREAYLAKLKPDARERAEEAAAWDKAGLQAAGQKVMDDPRKLAKALKRQEKAKQKKRDAWRDRNDSVRQGKEERQKKRNENIEKRKQLIAASKAKGKGKGPRASGSNQKRRNKPGHRPPVKGF